MGREEGEAAGKHKEEAGLGGTGDLKQGSGSAGLGEEVEHLETDGKGDRQVAVEDEGGFCASSCNSQSFIKESQIQRHAGNVIRISAKGWRICLVNKVFVGQV